MNEEWGSRNMGNLATTILSLNKKNSVLKKCSFNLNQRETILIITQMMSLEMTRSKKKILGTMN